MSWIGICAQSKTFLLGNRFFSSFKIFNGMAIYVVATFFYFSFFSIRAHAKVVYARLSSMISEKPEHEEQSTTFSLSYTNTIIQVCVSMSMSVAMCIICKIGYAIHYMVYGLMINDHPAIFG